MKIFTKSNLLTLSFLILVTTIYSQSETVSFTNQSGLIGSGSTTADCAVDMNGDFLDDIVRVASNGIYIDYQQPDGTFTQTFFPMTIQNTPGWSIAAGDIDGNGFNDLVFGNGSRASFCMANDDGTAYTEDARPEYIFCQRTTLNDVDNDGNLDAFIMHDVDQSHPYRNDGSGYLELDQTLIETLDVGGNYAAIWCDYDNDHDSDLFITKCRGSAPAGDARRVNLLYQNNGDGTYTEVGEAANMNDGNQSWATLFEDFDNDGDFDVFTVNHSSSDMPGGARNVYKINNGDGTFTNAIEGTGINEFDLGAWNCDAGDFDNNGFIDIFSEMDEELYMNNGDGTFTSQGLGFDSGGIGDFNDDGFLDVVNGNSVHINNGNDNNWFKIALDGIISNKNGIGAKIEIYGSWGVQVREIRSGESFDPMSSLVGHFGLGQATAIDNIVVYWPSGIISNVDNPAINETLILPEAGCFADPSTISVTGSLTICEGESTTLTAAVGESYTWSNGSSDQELVTSESGNYSVVVWNEDGCASVSNTVQVTVQIDQTPEISMVGEDTFCEGGSVTLISSMNGENTWSNAESGQSIEVMESGTYSVTTVGQCTGNSFVSEDVTINVLASPAPVVEDIIVTESGTVNLTATGNNVTWYNSEDLSMVVGSGNTYSVLFSGDNSETYWATNTTTYGGGSEVGGKLDNSGGGGLPSSGGVLNFNADEPFTLATVTVYVPTDAPAGNRTFWVRDANNTVLESGEFYLEIGENQVDLNFDVPAGINHQLGSDQNNMFRNNDITSYPFAIGSVGQITTSTFGTQYYYYFYNWQIELAEVSCESAADDVTISMVNIDENNIFNSLDVYPNPVLNDQLYLNYQLNNTQKINVSLYNSIGEMIYSSEFSGSNESLTINTSKFAAGLYQVVLSGDDVKITRSIVFE